MKLILADGTVFTGHPFGAAKEVAGEVVFNTGLTGYVETLTDPSYRGQILVLTYPMQGNYGVPEGPFESARIQVQGLVVTHYSDRPNHHSAVRSLGTWLRAEGVPAISGIDTRTLTRRLREHGTMTGHLLIHEGNDDLEVAKARAEKIDMSRVAELVTSHETVTHEGGELRILVIDTGAKENIVRSLLRRGASVVQVPYLAAWENQLGAVDGVMLTNGPGDPRDLEPLVARLRATILARGIPTFGICLGHQLLARAAGCDTFKLPYGHRSHNQPVIECASRRAYVTSQNHGYAVCDTMPRDWETWFENLNDGTNAGIRHTYRPFRSVQFHPEAAAGPRDTAFLFDDFLRMVGEMRKASRHV